MSYDSILVHLTMLRDAVRTAGYQRAIAQVVKPGDHVLDFGCGTGVLSVFAARAGAGRVYAVDRSRMIDAAKQVIADNACPQIELITGEGEDVVLPGPVDVLVSEWMGHFLFAEPMLEPLLRLRDRYLKPGGTMLPARCSLHVGLVSARKRYDELAFLRDKPYGVDFRAVSSWPFFEVVTLEIAGDELLPESCCIGTLDMSTIKAMPDQLTGAITTAQGGVAYGLCGWFDAELAPGNVLSTDPRAPRTHWHQFFFPFDQPLELGAGERVEIALQPLTVERATAWSWRATAPRGTRTGDNLVHQAWLSRSPR